MKKKGIVIFIILFMVIIAPLSVFLYNTKMIAEEGENQVIETLELDDMYKAIVFKRDMGATTAESYHLSIIKRKDTIDNTDKGNIYVSDYCFEIKWNNNEGLWVYTKTNDKYYKKKEKFKNIHITYR